MSKDVTNDPCAENGSCSDSEWVRRWEEGEAYWHSETLSPYLLKNSEAILDGPQKRIFLPLCGKAAELIWLYQRGHVVVGVEIAERPVRELFVENSVEFDIEQFPGIGNLYKSKDGRLSVWAANIFNVPAQNYDKFDIIWDSKAFIAINLSDQKRYIELMHTIMSQTCIYYLQTMEYDTSVWPGPPHSISGEMVMGGFGVEIAEENAVKTEKAKPSNGARGSEEGSSTKVDNTSPHSDPAIEAIRQSSFIIARWYRMTLK